MNEDVTTRNTSQGCKVLLPAELKFDHYRSIMAAMENAEDGSTLAIDFAALSHLPSWLLGLLLTVEETAHKRHITLRVTGCTDQQRAILHMARLDRFLGEISELTLVAP